jgi:hypothetical protein
MLPDAAPLCHKATEKSNKLSPNALPASQGYVIFRCINTIIRKRCWTKLLFLWKYVSSCYSFILNIRNPTKMHGFFYKASIRVGENSGRDAIWQLVFRLRIDRVSNKESKAHDIFLLGFLLFFAKLVPTNCILLYTRSESRFRI